MALSDRSSFLARRGAFEAGALAALDHLTDLRPDLEDVSMAVAEHIGALIEERAVDA